MADLACLATFPKTGRENPPWAVKALSSGHLKHPGRMRVPMAIHALEWLKAQLAANHRYVIVDIGAGIGSTTLAAHKCGFTGFIGCELDPKWHPMLQDIAWSLFGFSARVYFGHAGAVPIEEPSFPHLRGCSILWSPPFPNAKSPGKTPYVDHVMASKGTTAGTEMIDQGLWRGEKKFKKSLRLSLNPWLWEFDSGGHILIHIKNYVRKNIEQRVDLWVAEVLDSLGCDSIGYLAAPLDYLSQWHQWRIYPERLIVERQALEEPSWDKGKVRVVAQEKLECGHWRFRRANMKAGEFGRCVECGPIPDLVVVQEERFVVGVKR